METVTEKKIVMVDVDKIIPAAFNPPKRVSALNIKELKDSIDEIGIVYPLIVDDKLNLIDGHRRLTCAKALNYKQIPVLITKHDAKRLFDDVNRTSSKLSKKDELYIYLSGGPVSAKAKENIEKLKEYLDQKDLEYAAENRISHTGLMFSIVLLLRYLKNTDKLTPTFKKKMAKYLLYNAQSFAVRRAIGNEMEPALMVAAIETNAPLG